MSNMKFVACLLILGAISSTGLAQDPFEVSENLPQAEKLPLANSLYEPMLQQQLLTIPQQRAKFAADQRMLRMEWNNWIGYSPLRPNVNASYMSQGMPNYYIYSRGVIVNGNSRAWYW